METPSPLFLEAKRLRLKKRFSQNFLVNEGVLERIVAVVDPQASETTVEIGPGAGFLTERLLPRAGHLYAVELDRQMAAYLRGKFKTAENLTLVEQDILKFPFESIETPRLKVVGNLPYNITSPILFKLVGELDAGEHPLRQRLIQATLMVQREVGERITALPGRKAYNPLSIAVQLWFEARLDFIVPARSFYPAPKVESAVITLTPRTEPRYRIQDLALFSRMIRTAFSQRRKTLRNTLKGFADELIVEKVFQETGIDSSLRPEALSIEDFGALANAFSQCACQD